MKKMLAAFVVFSGLSAMATSPIFPFPQPVNGRAVQLAQTLTWELGQTSRLLEQEAITVQQFGNWPLAQALRDAAWTVNSLSNNVDREVAQPLRFRQPLYVAARALQNMQWEFQNATAQLQRLGFRPMQTQMSINRAASAHIQLKQILGVF